MTKRYPGGYITKTPPTVSTTSAPGIWTMEQQAAYQKAGTWPFGGPFVYIEDVFSTWLYTGTGASQTITNGIDLSGQGGLVWTKNRSTYNYGHQLFDTARGAGYDLATNSTAAQNYDLTNFSSFNSTGFTIGPNANANVNGVTNVSWTFRKQPKFFDVVTYTGNYTARTIAHSLGSVPGCIIVKKTSSADDWRVYHRSLATNQYMTLETTAAVGTSATMWNNTAPTSTVFSIGAEGSVNDPGETFVAYLFAHNAGGFGLTGTDNVISCGSCTGNSDVNLGYEPQWVMVKRTNTTGEWVMVDNMRGMVATTTSDCQQLYANSSNAEAGNQYSPHPTSTGFYNRWINGTDSFIYIAIRRGPMKTPTSGTSVFAPISSANSTGTKQTTSFPVDMQLLRYPQAGYNNFAIDRLRGVGTSTSAFATPYLVTNTTDAEATLSSLSYQWDNTGFGTPSAFNGLQSIYWNFRRAPGFFDEVCYTGTGSATTQAHNLGVAPELMIVKQRSGANYWPVYSAAIGNDYILSLDTTGAKDGPGAPQWNNTAPTASVFSLGASSGANASGGTYVAYLFASCPGVSKVGSYTGTGTTKQIDCGFTGGARFVLIKRTDSTGDWYVWDSARGIVAGNDPYLLLNSTAAEVTNTDYVDTYAAGFEISSTAPAAINANGGTFIFLAIA